MGLPAAAGGVLLAAAVRGTLTQEVPPPGLHPVVGVVPEVDPEALRAPVAALLLVFL